MIYEFGRLCLCNSENTLEEMYLIRKNGENVCIKMQFCRNVYHWSRGNEVSLKRDNSALTKKQNLNSLCSVIMNLFNKEKQRGRDA